MVLCFAYLRQWWSLLEVKSGKGFSVLFSPGIPLGNTKSIGGYQAIQMLIGVFLSGLGVEQRLQSAFYNVYNRVYEWGNAARHENLVWSQM